VKLDVTGTVRRGDDGWRSARVLVHDDGRAAVWWGKGMDNVLVWSGRATVEDQSGGGHGPWLLTATDGQAFTVERRSCGCGTRLFLLGETDLVRVVTA
jgi:hypothetical protein